MFGYIGNLQDILFGETTLQPGQKYTFTIDSGSALQLRSDHWVYENLKKNLFNFATVISVYRPLFSYRFVVTIHPKFALPLRDMIDQFESAFRKMGYPKASFVIAETGTTSSTPGGITAAMSGAVTSVARTTGEVIREATNPLIIPLIIGSITMVGAMLMRSK